MNREIVYPFLLECCEHTQDSYWFNIFEELAYGKAPYRTYISSNFLCCNHKKKEFTYKLENKYSSEQTYKELYNLLKNRLGLLSHQDKINNKELFNIVEQNIKETRTLWTNIRKKNVKDLMIELYVIRMKKKHQLNHKQTKYLMSIIFLAIVFKVITYKDIDYSENKINHIDGIDFENKKVILKTNIYNINVSFEPYIFLDKKILSEHWDKYIKELKKIQLVKD